jgi:hypothetical protein
LLSTKWLISVIIFTGLAQRRGFKMNGKVPIKRSAFD